MLIKFNSYTYINLFKHPLLGISINKWLKLLVKNKCNVYVKFIPKIIFLTLFSILNLPFQLFEAIIYSAKIKKTTLKSPVFVIGHPRSGTTYLNNLLSKDPSLSYSNTYDVLVPHIFLTFNRGLKNVMSKVLPATRPQDNVKMTIDSPKEEEFAMANISQTSYFFGFFFPKRIYENLEESVLFTNDANRKHWKEKYDYFLKKIAFKNGNNRLLLKSPANTARIKEIYELYPDAKFIHIYRNPYDVYRSTVRLYEKIIPITSFQRIHKHEIEDFILTAYPKIHDKYLAGKNIIPSNQIYELKYEDFITSPVSHIEKAYDFLGIDSFNIAKTKIEKEVDDLANYKNNTYSELPQSIKSRINHDWKFWFNEFKYDLKKV